MSLAQTEPSVPHGFTASWIQSALESRCVGVEVNGCTLEPVGTGQVAATYRVTPRYRTSGPLGPRTLILKCPPGDPAIRRAAQSSGSHIVEMNFYRELSTVIDVRVPICWGAEHDESTGDYLLLLEDAAPAVPGDQLAGCTPAQARLAIEEIVRLHARFWGPRDTDTLPWLRHRDREAKRMVDHCRWAVDNFLNLYAGRMGAATAALSGHLGELLTTYLSAEWEAPSVVHADFRIDNLLFFPDPARRPVVVDWGGIAVGPPVADVSYLLGASLPPQDRRMAEAELVRGYHARLSERGVDTLTWEQCWHEYRVHSVSGMVMAIFAPLIVQRTDRGDELFVTMAERHAEQIRDLGAMDLVMG